MIGKNIEYYRLKEGVNKKKLAQMTGVTSTAISNYEKGKRKPDADVLKKIASALGIRLLDLLGNRPANNEFVHGEFRKQSKLSKSEQLFIKKAVEEYFERFSNIIDILGEHVLPKTIKTHQIVLSGDIETDAKRLRQYLKLPDSGPVNNLVELLENRGIFIVLLDIQNNGFSGINGIVNGRAYIAVNQNMTPERCRSTIVHEMAHAFFIWPEEMPDKEIEKKATAISGAFLFPKEDVTRELGLHRSRISGDMALVCKEYGISMYLLTKRAEIVGVISESAAKRFYIEAGKMGWRRNEPVRIEKEEPSLFKQLVYRAVSENEISVQKGAELLKLPYKQVEKDCFLKGA